MNPSDNDYWVRSETHAARITSFMFYHDILDFTSKITNFEIRGSPKTSSKSPLTTLKRILQVAKGIEHP